MAIDRRPQEIKNDSQIYDSYVGLYRRVTDTTSEADIGIRREGDRLFAQIVRSNPSPIDKLLFSGTAELLPESETVFFERLTGKVVRFWRDAQRNVVDLALNDGDQSLAYKKISATPPILEKVKLRAAIKLNTALLDAYVGKYEFPPTAVPTDGAKLKIWREGDQLVGELSGETVPKGAFNLYPESQTSFSSSSMTRNLPSSTIVKEMWQELSTIRPIGESQIEWERKRMVNDSQNDPGSAIQC